MKSILRILYISSWLSWFAASLFGPIYAIFVQEIGGDLLDAGMAYAVFSIAMGLFTLVMGKLEQRTFDRRKALVWGYALLMGTTLAYLSIQNPYQLFIVQAFMGVGAAINYPAWDALFSRAVEKGKESIEWGTQEGGMQIVAGIAAILGSFVAVTFGFEVLFLAMAFIQSLSIAAALSLFRKKHRVLRQARVRRYHNVHHR